MTKAMVKMQRDAENSVYFDTANGAAKVDKVTKQQFKHFS